MKQRNVAIENQIGLIQQALGQGDNLHAEKLCLDLLQDQPDLLAGSFLLGIARFRTGRHSEGIELVERAARQQPDNSNFHLQLGTMQASVRAWDKAQASFARAIECSPTNADSHFFLGTVLKETGELEESEKALREALRLRPSDPRVHANLLDILSDQARWAEAVEHGRAALRYSEAQPAVIDSLAAHNRLGKSLKEMGEYSAAIVHLDKADNELSRAVLLECLLGQGRYDDFFDTIRSNVERDATNLAVSSVSAYGAQKLGREDPHPFCPAPMEYVRIYENLGLESEQAAQTLVDALKAEFESRQTVWEPKTNATTKGYQTVGNQLKENTGPLARLRELLSNQIDEYREEFKSSGHDLIRKWPASTELFGWYVSLLGGGYEAAHNHRHGWVSGVLYLQVPKCSDDPEAGAIEFGLKAPEYPELSGENLIRLHQPKVGQLILFPSNLYHRTIPNVSFERRMSFAFDLCPL